MSKHFYIPGLLSLFLLTGFFSGRVATQPTSPPDEPVIKHQAFTQGEYLQFRVHYGFINAGFASIEVAEELDTTFNSPCYHILGKGWTSSGFDVFYKVRDTYESFMDTQSLLPMRFNRAINEGKFESYTEVRFDQEAHIAYYTDNNKKVTPYPVPPSIQDVISSFYFARSSHDHETFQPGDRISLRNFIDRKTFGLEAELIEREVIKVGGKKYKALHMKLLIEESGMLTDGGKIEFWISDDFNKVPLRIQSDLSIGTLKADLIESRGLKYPFDARLN